MREGSDFASENDEKLGTAMAGKLRICNPDSRLVPRIPGIAGGSQAHTERDSLRWWVASERLQAEE